MISVYYWSTWLSISGRSSWAVNVGVLICTTNENQFIFPYDNRENIVTLGKMNSKVVKNEQIRIKRDEK